MSALHNTRGRSRNPGALLGLVALFCLPLMEAAHPFLYYANHARRGYGRNIQPLPCATKEGDTGVCMFAWDCMKAEGTHLGTCIERFYFGSCCKLKPGSKKPEHTVMKTDVYVLATTSRPQTGATAALSSSAPQTGSNLLGMITGQTTLNTGSFDTSTSRTTLLNSGNDEESPSTVQEVQQVFGAGAPQEVAAQSTSSTDLDMDAIEQQMAEESGAQETKGGENNETQVDSDSQLENGDKNQATEEGMQVSSGGTTSGQTVEAPASELTSEGQSLNEATEHQTDKPTFNTSTVEEGLLFTEESEVTTNQADQSDQNKPTLDEDQITSIQELGEALLNQEQNEIEGGQQLAAGDDGSSDQDQLSQVSHTDQNSGNITPEIQSQVPETEIESNQDSESQVTGIGIGTVTSVEIDYVLSATEASSVQSGESQGQTIIENEIVSEHVGDETLDSSSVTSVVQGTTASQISGSDSNLASTSAENEVGGEESPAESSTAADSSTSTGDVGEQTYLSEVTESSGQTTEPEESETAPATEAIYLTTYDSDASSVSSEQTESEALGEETSDTKTTLPAVAVSEKPLGHDEPDEPASQPSESNVSSVSSEVSGDGSLVEVSATVAPQQTDSTVLPEPSGSESSSDAASVDTPDSSSPGESGESATVEGLAADSVIVGPDDEANATTSEGDSAQGGDVVAAVTETTSGEASIPSEDDASAADGPSNIDASANDKGDAASDSESEDQAATDAGDVSASTAESGASTGTTISSDVKTPDVDASQSGSSTESGIEGDEHTAEENISTNGESPVTVSPSNVLEGETNTSLPSLGENVIVPGVQIVPAPESMKNESVAMIPQAGSGEDVSSGGSGDLTTDIPKENITTEAPSTGSASAEVSSTDKSSVDSSSEVSKPDEEGAVVVGIDALLPNGTAQPEQQFETQEEQLLHRLKTSSFREICGQPVYPSRRIVGGSQASFGEWPWQVSLRQWRSVTYLHKCGAALVNENWAITAAHCVENVLPDQLLLRLGEFDLERADEPYGHVERKVQIIATHPQFDPRTFEYDLALLRFNEPVTFQPNIIPICIPDDDYDFIGDTGFVSGWGRLYEDGPLPSLMQKVPVPVITNGECEIMYRNAGYIEDIPNIFICAGYESGKRDSCEGDSGGPLVIQHESSWKLAGVISWGIGCALPNQPGVYTRISAFREWINKIIVF